MQKFIFALLLAVVLLLPASPVFGEAPAGLLDPGNVSVSSRLAASKIVFVHFLPPSDVITGWVTYERAFTGEISIEEKSGAEKGFFFLPRNCLDLVHRNIRAAGARHRLSFEIVDTVARIPRDADTIVLGAVVYCLSGSEAVVELDCEVLDGKTGATLGRTTFSRKVGSEGIPFLIGRPVHMIGSHMNDFHPQRTLINAAVYLCVTDMIRYLDDLAGKRK